MDNLRKHFIATSCALLTVTMLASAQISLAQKAIPGGTTNYDALTSPKPFASGVTGLGAISSFSVSTTVWKPEGHTESAIAYSYLWKHVKDGDVTLNITWRGPRLPEALGKTVNAILAQKPHVLTAAETRALGNVMRYSNGFEFSSVETKNLGGARVIAVSGTHKGWELHEDAIFVKSSDDGQVFQKVSFSAPPKKYAEFKRDGLAALNGLRLVHH